VKIYLIYAKKIQFSFFLSDTLREDLRKFYVVHRDM
jgi:hypothetical protein